MSVTHLTFGECFNQSLPYFNTETEINFHYKK